MKRSGLLPALLVLLIGACLLWWSARSATRAPLSQEAYVWQRSWTAGVGEAVVESVPTLSGLLCLAAELSVEEGTFRQRHIRVDHEALRRSGGRITAVVRIFPSVAAGGWTGERIAECTEAMKSLLEEWSGEHPGGFEFQIDYDCPESRLAEFHDRLRVWRSLFSGTRITFTALPTWLGRGEFAPLAKEFPGYVMQVHSLHLPDDPGRWVGLCDPVEMEAALRQAAALGVDFRLALPTYSCLVVLDASGSVAEVYGEDIPESFPLGLVDAVAMDSDPHLLAQLLREWSRTSPPELRGIVWYRLPTPEDRLNWDWPLLERVISGVPLSRGWSLRTEPDPTGFHRVVLLQNGSAPDDLPPVLRVKIPGARAIGCDGLGDYVGTTRSEAEETTIFEWHLAEPVRHFHKPPGWSAVVGWCRWEGGADSPLVEIPEF